MGGIFGGSPSINVAGSLPKVNVDDLAHLDEKLPDYQYAPQPVKNVVKAANTDIAKEVQAPGAGFGQAWHDIGLETVGGGLGDMYHGAILQGLQNYGAKASSTWKDIGKGISDPYHDLLAGAGKMGSKVDKAATDFKNSITPNTGTAPGLPNMEALVAMLAAGNGGAGGGGAPNFSNMPGTFGGGVPGGGGGMSTDPNNPFRQAALANLATLQQQATGVDAQGNPIQSQAQMQADQARASNVAAAIGMANSARGGFNPALMRGAMNAAGTANAQGAVQSQQAGQQERIAAATALSNAANQGYGQDINQSSVQMQQEANAQKMAQAHDELVQKYSGMGLQHQEAQVHATLDLAKMQQQAYIDNQKLGIAAMQARNGAMGNAMGALGGLFGGLVSLFGGSNAAPQGDATAGIGDAPDKTQTSATLNNNSGSSVGDLRQSEYY